MQRSGSRAQRYDGGGVGQWLVADGDERIVRSFSCRGGSRSVRGIGRTCILEQALSSLFDHPSTSESLDCRGADRKGVISEACVHQGFATIKGEFEVGDLERFEHCSGLGVVLECIE